MKTEDLKPGDPIRVLRYRYVEGVPPVKVKVDATFMGWDQPGKPIVKYTDESLHVLHTTKDMEYIA